MSGLHDPVVVDYEAMNLPGVNLIVRCLPGELLSANEASALCRKVGALFEHQGAEVRTTVHANGPLDEEAGAAPPDLILELRARRVHQANDPLRWAAFVASFTLFPAVTESTFAQDVTIRDGGGSLLATATLQGRLVRRFGAGVWAVNQVLNIATREDYDDIERDTASRDLSRDLYRQLSQLVVNADVQRGLLQEGAAWR